MGTTTENQPATYHRTIGSNALTKPALTSHIPSRLERSSVKLQFQVVRTRAHCARKSADDGSSSAAKEGGGLVWATMVCVRACRNFVKLASFS